jgi:hypothetical protein
MPAVRSGSAGRRPGILIPKPNRWSGRDLTFDHTEATPPDGLFGLRLELQVEQVPEISDGGSSQNGGGGDDMTLASDNTILATFTFEFQLPVIEALSYSRSSA